VAADPLQDEQNQGGGPAERHHDAAIVIAHNVWPGAHDPAPMPG
jgi:hypothetical protein